jgi:CheY-like chemotaxis protein
MLAHPLQSRRIVLVEDDEVLQKHVASVLRGSFANLDVRGARDADEAIHLLEDERSRLLITDAQNHHFDGIAVATQARKLRPTLPVIVMSSAGSDSLSGKVPPLPAAAWLEKPPKVERLVGLVQRILSVPVGFSGEISIEGLPDLVQLLSMANASGALHIEHGDQHGSVWFDRGAIVDATLEGRHGVGVFHQMLAWEGGLFALDRSARAQQRSIHVPVMQLLLEGVQLLDEERVGEPALANGNAWTATSSTSQVRLRPVPESPNKIPVEQLVRPATMAERNSGNWSTPQQKAAEHFQRGMELALHKQYDAALREWERAASLDPANRTYQVNLRRLHEVRRRSAPLGETHGDEK